MRLWTYFLQTPGTFTGRARVRPGRFGGMVLQVEETWVNYSSCPPMPGSDPQKWREQMIAEGKRETHWRDATFEDVQAGQFTVGNWGHEPPRPLPAPMVHTFHVNDDYDARARAQIDAAERKKKP